MIKVTIAIRLRVSIRVMIITSLTTLLTKLHRLTQTTMLMTAALAMRGTMATIVIMVNTTVSIMVDAVVTLATTMAIKATSVMVDTAVMATVVEAMVTTDLFMSMEESDNPIAQEATMATNIVLSTITTTAQVITYQFVRSLSRSLSTTPTTVVMVTALVDMEALEALEVATDTAAVTTEQRDS